MNWHVLLYIWLVRYAHEPHHSDTKDIFRVMYNMLVYLKFNPYFCF